MLTYKIDDELYLRAFTRNDIEEFHELTIQSKSYLRKWLGWLDNVQTQENTAHNIESRINEFVENEGFPKSFAIIHREKIAGTIGFNDIDRTAGIGTIGYWLGEEFQGQGIMTKSFEALIKYGFEDLKLNRIEVRVAVGNRKSRALPERFDFREEGRIRQAEWLYDHYVDNVLYGLLHSEWKKSKND